MEPIIKVHRPLQLTPDELEKRMQAIHDTAARLIVATETQKRRNRNDRNRENDD